MLNIKFYNFSIRFLLSNWEKDNQDYGETMKFGLSFTENLRTYEI